MLMDSFDTDTVVDSDRVAEKESVVLKLSVLDVFGYDGEALMDTVDEK